MSVNLLVRLWCFGFVCDRNIITSLAIFRIPCCLREQPKNHVPQSSFTDHKCFITDISEWNNYKTVLLQSIRRLKLYKHIQRIQLICSHYNYLSPTTSSTNVAAKRCTGWRKNRASLSHCKYSEISMTELRGNWWLVINFFLFKNFIALWRHLSKTQLLCDAQIYLYSVNKR